MKKFKLNDNYRATYDVVIACAVAEEAMRMDNGKYNSVSDWIQGVVNRHMKELYDARIEIFCKDLTPDNPRLDDHLNTIKKLRKMRHLIR